MGLNWRKHDRSADDTAIRETGGEIVGVMSSNPLRADYAAEHGIPNSTSDLDALLAMDIDAVYISTVNDLHKPQTLAAGRGQTCAI